MAPVYYIQAGATTINDEPAQAPLPAPWVSVTQAQYLQEIVNIAQSSPELQVSFGLQLLVSRSEFRTAATPLHGAALDAGKLYSIFVPNNPTLFYSQVEFFLDSIPIHTEFTTPWDYDGTGGGGAANRVSFVSGSYSVDAVVTYPGGTFTISADVGVD